MTWCSHYVRITIRFRGYPISVWRFFVSFIFRILNFRLLIFILAGYIINPRLSLLLLRTYGRTSIKRGALPGQRYWICTKTSHSSCVVAEKIKRKTGFVWIVFIFRWGNWLGFYAASIDRKIKLLLKMSTFVYYIW